MKIKFNSIDLLIIILLIAVTAAGGWFMTNRGKQSALSSNKTVEVTVELTDKDKAFTELPKIGDRVVLGEKVKMNAVVTKVDIKNATMLGYDTLGGRILDSEIPEHYDVQITVQAQGSESPGEVTINGNGVRVGMGIAMKAKDWSGYGYALAVETL